MYLNYRLRWGDFISLKRECKKQGNDRETPEMGEEKVN